MNRAIVGGISREELRKTIESFGRTWLRWKDQFCSWCHAALTEEDVNAYAEWCVELGKLVRNRTPENRVPCRSCAGPAMLEIVDGVKFAPHARPSTEPSDPWSRPRWSEEQRGVRQ